MSTSLPSSAALRAGILVCAAALTWGCGSDVANERSDSGTAGAGGSTSTGSTGSGGCGAWAGDCAHCGSDAYVSEECVGGEWTCPPGTQPPETCSNDPYCPGDPAQCEECAGDQWMCFPSDACIPATAQGCPAVVCTTCEGAPSSVLVGGCECSCDGATQTFGCTLAAGCCNVDFDCGDAVYVPCVEHVCKTPVAGGCWTDAECPSGTCVGASVCPCGFDCDGADTPGTCM